jgi:hypothetical protein
MIGSGWMKNTGKVSVHFICQSRAGLARWYTFIPKIPVRVNLEGLAWKGYCWFVNLWLFGIFYCNLVYFVVIWYSFPGLGMLCQEKSGTLFRDQLRLIIYINIIL